jgi:hypothetical protein
MDYYPKRSERTRRIKLRKRKFKVLLIANLWLIYFIFLSFNFISTNNTYSYFSDEEKIENTFSTAENFCTDEGYRNNHKDVCKDNAGIGNGSENVDQSQFVTGDEDNPGHQAEYCDDPNTPEIEVCNDQNNGNGNTKNNSNASGSEYLSPNVSGTSP